MLTQTTSPGEWNELLRFMRTVCEQATLRSLLRTGWRGEPPPPPRVHALRMLATWGAAQGGLLDWLGERFQLGRIHTQASPPADVFPDLGVAWEDHPDLVDDGLAALESEAAFLPVVEEWFAALP